MQGANGVTPGIRHDSATDFLSGWWAGWQDGMPAYVNGNGHKGSNCVIRGGSWNNNARNCRVS